MRLWGTLLLLLLIVGCMEFGEITQVDNPESSEKIYKENGLKQVKAEPEEAPTTTPKTRPAFDEFILEKYSNLEEYNGLLRIEEDRVIKVPEELAEHYFASEDEGIKKKAQEWSSGSKTLKGNLANMINWARAKTTYDSAKAESDDIYWQTAGETLETGRGICGDQARLMASLLYNAGYTNVTLVSADCKGESINGLHGFVVLYYEGEVYYIDLTNDFALPFDPATKNYYTILCKDVYQVITPTMLISDYLS